MEDLNTDTESLKSFLSELVKGLKTISDPESVNLIRHTRKELEGLCEQLLKKRKSLKSVKKDLENVFDDPDFVDTQISDGGMSLCFFPKVYNFFSGLILNYIDEYLKIASEYEIHVKDKLGGLEDIFDRRADKLNEPIEVTITAAKISKNLLEKSAELFIETKTKFPKTLEKLQKYFSYYEKYLNNRFVKADETPKNRREMLKRIDEEEIVKGKYVKVKLMDDNPILTDILLEIIEEIPKYNRIRVDKRKEEKKLSNYGVEESAKLLSALADPKMSEYINDLPSFFKKIGNSLEKFYKAIQSLEKYNKEILDSNYCRIVTTTPLEMIKLLDRWDRRIEKNIDSLKKFDLDDIVQNYDETTPNNKREIDYFKLRQRAFDILADGIYKLSGIEDVYDRTDKAKKIVLEVAELKDMMNQLTTSSEMRKLRRNKKEDNEYYEGRRKEIGEFDFERMPAPEIKIGEVIGESFDRAKKHLNEIIETGNFPRLMQLSAPGKKIRSNILLIGPYGCGKTELARAICADKRVIGASVSVADTLTAYMHESVNNVKRIYESAMKLKKEALDQKPVALILDEFDSWFARGEGNYSDKDMQQIESILLQVLDGMTDYNGIITIAMTNEPRAIPKAILRRFRYVDIVGELTHKERENMLKMYIEKTLPIDENVSKYYSEWAKKLDGAVGDVVRKVVDEIHFDLIPKFIKGNKIEAQRIERVLHEREIKRGSLSDNDIKYIKDRLQNRNIIVTPEHVNKSLDYLLKQAPIQMQINVARKVYDDAKALLEEITGHGFGFRKGNRLFDY